jgi:hypothetical protein
MERVCKTAVTAWMTRVLSVPVLALFLLCAACSDRPSGDIHPAGERGINAPLGANDVKASIRPPEAAHAPMEEGMFQDEDDRDDAGRDNDEW